MAVRLNAMAIFGAEMDRDIMQQYAEAMSRRKFPIKLEVLESQMEEGE